ncbi:hypothetical protein P153DRAFT_356694 [Dothidotthia symphoricarpi CBS 119687]|uniref:Uncharacterized protein n=1 Tax=Dothidotthia symphoricarpi CBS 119687 TaxID=1392245 RepID=A0A6A6AGJ1_9PLEO|nr:uncharacterized protein P153DRAFT_356694 [Dothidotthia symphoricarpi CBS 119687]KAF2130034.1 hypothetical protein P153DRAFT_356694 [Dothidotthia symphoricarpi CBS 119687]
MQSYLRPPLTNPSLSANARLLYGNRWTYDVVIGRETAMKCRICLVAYPDTVTNSHKDIVLKIVDSDICKKHDKWEDPLDHVSQAILSLVEELGADVAEKTGLVPKNSFFDGLPTVTRSSTTTQFCWCELQKGARITQVRTSSAFIRSANKQNISIQKVQQLSQYLDSYRLLCDSNPSRINQISPKINQHLIDSRIVEQAQTSQHPSRPTATMMVNDYSQYIERIRALANARLLFGRHQSYDVVIGRESSTRCKACLIEYDEKLKKGGSVLGSVIIESKQCLPNTYAEDALRQLLVELEFNVGRRISGLEILAKIEGKSGLIYIQ